jgi:preprotein translocase subunit SecG
MMYNSICVAKEDTKNATTKTTIALALLHATWMIFLKVSQQRQNNKMIAQNEQRAFIQ